MPKNVKGGSKHKKMKNNSNNDEISKDDLILKEEGQNYGKVEKLLGDCRMSILSTDNITKVGLIRGSMRKKQWVNVGDIVLYSDRDFESDKVDIIHVYKPRVLQILASKMNLTFSNKDEIDNMFNNNSEKITEDNFDLFEYENEHNDSEIYLDDI